MKNVNKLLFAGLVLAFGLSSCSNDDAPAASIVGKWNYSKEGFVMNGQEYLSDYDGNETGCQKDYLQVNSNGSFSDVDYDSSSTPCEMFSDTGSWSKSGNTLTITYPGEPAMNAEIMVLTSTKLKVKIEESGMTFISEWTKG
jgi:hypothetical protein